MKTLIKYTKYTLGCLLLGVCLISQAAVPTTELLVVMGSIPQKCASNNATIKYVHGPYADYQTKWVVDGVYYEYKNNQSSQSSGALFRFPNVPIGQTYVFEVSSTNKVTCHPQKITITVPENAGKSYTPPRLPYAMP